MVSSAVALFLFGMIAGFVLTRLLRIRPGQARDRLTEGLGWAVMSVALTLALALLAWAVLG